MKRKLLSLIGLLQATTIMAQTAPQGNPPAPNTTDRAAAAWYRGGNNAIATTPPGANIFGTLWNSPIYTQTNGVHRMKLNGSYGAGQYTVNGYVGTTLGIDRSGYVLMGKDMPMSWGGPNELYSNYGAFSQLHLNGGIGADVQQFGYRPWMQTGVTFTDNQDLSYIGLRQVGTGFDATETVITWSDNAGIDDFTLRFTNSGGGSGTGASISTSNLMTPEDLDGLHVARFTGSGNFGLGNTFGINPAGTPNNLYVSPASLGHYSLSNFRSVWQQFTNRNTANGTGTGETESDGLRIGIIGNSNTNVNGTAAIYNQETRALLFSTNANTTSVNVTNGTTLERMRIMSVETPTHLSSGGFGTYNPGSIPANITRMAISHDPSQPVTRPLSLLHLGYNTGLNSSPLGSTDGWRSWMDIGTFTSNGTDNMYVGLKNEGTDRFDAVVSWGDNQSAGLSNEGPDNLRFIFTSTTSSVINPGDPVSQSANGLEVARMHPGQASTLTNNYGMVGIGNFTSNAIDAKLDIDGDLRIRTVTQDNSLTRVLVIDPNDHNRVHYADIDLPAGGSGFVECSDTTGTTDLTGDSKLNLNNNNLYFENNGVLGKNHIGIGYDCSDPLPGKLSVIQQFPAPVTASTTAGYFVNISQNAQTVSGVIFTGVLGGAVGNNFYEPGINTGGAFYGANATRSIGITGGGIGNSSSTTSAIGGDFSGSGGNHAYGVEAVGRSGLIASYGGRFSAEPISGTNGYGIRTIVSGAGDNHYGVYSEAFGASIGNWAGYFIGDVYISGSYGPSDKNLKRNIENYTNANDILSKLRPTSYSFRTDEYPQLNLDDRPQIGLISQEVEEIFPSAVKETTSMPKFNDEGELEYDAVTFKAIAYEKFIPILIGGHQEQQSEIEALRQENKELRNQVNQLNEKMDVLIRCLQDKIPDLCKIEQGMIQQNQGNEEQIRHIIEIELQNGTAIVLNQNVPNPFAESTVITFSIPETIADAQIVFHDSKGSLIKTVDIHERGNGQINVYANDLSAGAYTYSLIADGKIVATKRMVKQ